MANYTKLKNIPTNPSKIQVSERSKRIAEIGVDLDGLITAYNLADTALTALTVTVGEHETAYEAYKVSHPLAGFREMDAAGVMAGVLGAQPTGTLDCTTDIVFTGDDRDSWLNGTSYYLQVAAAAANPTDTVLIVVTKAEVDTNDNRVTITVTPNDGTNNSATPVALTTAQLVLAINAGVSGTYDSIVCTLSGAALAYLGYVTTSGGGANDLADSGEGDQTTAFMNGGRLPGNGVLGTYTTPSYVPVIGGGGDEMLALTWVASNVDKIGISIPLPQDFSGAVNVTLAILAKSGGDTDTPTIGITTNWDNDDTPVADTSSAVNTDTADWAWETATIALADIPTAAKTVTIILTPGAHTTDTLQIAGVYSLISRPVVHA